MFVTVFTKLQNIYKEHPALYNTGFALILTFIIKPLFPHISFLLYFLLFSGSCCIIYGLLLHFEASVSKPVRLSAFILRVIALSLIAAFILSMVFIQFKIISGMKDTEKKCDYILLLGGGLVDNRPSKALIFRINRAIEYIEKYPDTKVILCGGKTYGQDISEAEAIKDYMVEQGIDESILILEDKSPDTTRNIAYAVNIIEQYGDNIKECDIGVVTSGYHIYRSMLIMQKAGIENRYAIVAKNPGYLIYNINCHLREYFSVVLEYLNL